MKSLLYHGFGIKGYRYRRTRYEKGEIIFELEPEERPEVPQGQKLMRRGFRWREERLRNLDVVSTSINPLSLEIFALHFLQSYSVLSSYIEQVILRKTHRPPPTEVGALMFLETNNVMF